LQKVRSKAKGKKKKKKAKRREKWGHSLNEDMNRERCLIYERGAQHGLGDREQVPSQPRRPAVNAHQV
jgi:hypothetical protein